MNAEDVLGTLLFDWAGELKRPGVSPARLRDFAERNGVAIPSDMAAFYSSADGMETMSEPSLIKIWSLDEVRRVHDVDPEYRQLGICDPNCFVFADWSLWCWAYGIVLSPDEDAPTPIFALHEDALRHVASSWTEFLHLCLKDDARILGDVQISTTS